jgi:hypothetical protein
MSNNQTYRSTLLYHPELREGLIRVIRHNSCNSYALVVQSK